MEDATRGAAGDGGGTGPDTTGPDTRGAAPPVARIRVALPTHLRALAGLETETTVEVPGPRAVTVRALLDALETRHPSLRGTIRDQRTGDRRPYMRYFAGRSDLSHDPPDAPLPEAVAAGEEVFRILGAIAGG